MARGQHKSRGQRSAYVTRFIQRHGMTREEWRTLKKENPSKAHEIRLRLA